MSTNAPQVNFSKSSKSGNLKFLKCIQKDNLQIHHCFSYCYTPYNFALELYPSIINILTSLWVSIYSALFCKQKVKLRYLLINKVIKFKHMKITWKFQTLPTGYYFGLRMDEFFLSFLSFKDSVSTWVEYLWVSFNWVNRSLLKLIHFTEHIKYNLCIIS